jgi:putative transposase
MGGYAKYSFPILGGDAKCCVSTEQNGYKAGIFHMDKYKGKYRIASNRLHNWDYGSHGLYFVTICTQHKHPYFGNIVETQYFASPKQDKKKNSPSPNQHEKQDSTAPGHNETHDKSASMQLTDIGRIAYRYWSEIPSHYPFIELDEFVVMPNHLHGILFFNRPGYHNWQPNTFGPQSGKLGAVIRGYKAAVKTYATSHQLPFSWQSRYHDHVIRSEKSLNHIREYIRNNSTTWASDRFHTSNV